jgi:hypothetical protein
MHNGHYGSSRPFSAHAPLAMRNGGSRSLSAATFDNHFG